MEHLGGVEKYLFDGLALLAREARHPEAPPTCLARAFARALEIAAADAPPARQVLVQVAVRTDVDRTLGRRAGTAGGGTAEARAAQAT